MDISTDANWDIGYIDAQAQQGYLLLMGGILP
jgi:hypothetical protein